jgi:hypothetical protein
MFARRTLGQVSAQTSAAVGASSLMASRRYDHDRWYGHTLELDIHNYKYTGVRPKWMRPDAKSVEEMKILKTTVPQVDLASTYELVIADCDRLNTVLNRKEYTNELKHRLEKQANTVARSQQLIKSGQYPQGEVEDTMIARIADEEHTQAEMKNVKCIRANEVAEDNRLDILPGGSPHSLREKTRWNVNVELHPIDRAEIGNRLMAWLPEKYHIVYVDDFQTAAANDRKLRAEMQTIVSNVSKEHAEEAKANGWDQDLKEVVAELEDDVDPSRHITSDKIKASQSLDELEEWSRIVHEYNGDERIFEIYERAAQLTKNEAHQALVKEMRTLFARKVVKS